MKKIILITIILTSCERENIIEPTKYEKRDFEAEYYKNDSLYQAVLNGGKR